MKIVKENFTNAICGLFRRGTLICAKGRLRILNRNGRKWGGRIGRKEWKIKSGVGDKPIFLAAGALWRGLRAKKLLMWYCYGYWNKAVAHGGAINVDLEAFAKEQSAGRPPATASKRSQPSLSKGPSFASLTGLHYNFVTWRYRTLNLSL